MKISTLCSNSKYLIDMDRIISSLENSYTVLLRVSDALLLLLVVFDQFKQVSSDWEICTRSPPKWSLTKTQESTLTQKKIIRNIIIMLINNGENWKKSPSQDTELSFESSFFLVVTRGGAIFGTQACLISGSFSKRNLMISTWMGRWVGVWRKKWRTEFRIVLTSMSLIW